MKFIPWPLFEVTLTLIWTVKMSGDSQNFRLHFLLWKISLSKSDIPEKTSESSSIDGLSNFFTFPDNTTGSNNYKNETETWKIHIICLCFFRMLFNQILNLFAFIHAWSLLPILLPIIPYVYRNKNLLTNLPIRILLSLQRLWTCIQQWVSNCRNILFMSEHDSERDCLKSNWEIKISSSRLLI